MKFPRIVSTGLSVWILLALLAHAEPAQAQYAALLPDLPTREKSVGHNAKQMDVLVALVDPFTQRATDMELPQMLAVLRHTVRDNASKGSDNIQREELLGDLEEIRYQGKKAWAAHVALSAPGLYQIITETRPRWDEARGVFEQQFVKTVLPVFGLERGWDALAGLKFEIAPLTRPFGLMAPALMTARVLLSGAPLAGGMVRIARLNTEKRGLPGEWHTVQTAKTNASGEFSFVCPLPGWWAFMAVTPGDALKGPDGHPKPLEMGAVLWVYVDDAKAGDFKPQKTAKP